MVGSADEGRTERSGEGVSPLEGAGAVISARGALGAMSLCFRNPRRKMHGLVWRRFALRRVAG